jgi:hypothetical protein
VQFVGADEVNYTLSECDSQFDPANLSCRLDMTSFYVNGEPLAEGFEIQFVVAAVNSNGQSGWSPNSGSGAVFYNGLPSAPPQVTSINQGTDVVLEWEEPSSPLTPITGYSVLTPTGETTVTIPETDAPIIMMLH